MSEQTVDRDGIRLAKSGFEGVPGRGSVNYILRNTQQQLVAQSSQADLKASILVTACSLVLTAGITQRTDARFEVAIVVLGVFLLVALVAAVLCVLPGTGSEWGHRPHVEVPRNLLFFGDFTLMDEDEFVDALGEACADDGEVYEIQARDLHRQGVYLVRHKYRYLRIGYLALLVGFCSSAVVAMVTLATT